MRLGNLGKFGKATAVAGIVGAALTFSHDAHATNGYFVYGFGPASKGMGGTGAAFSEDSMVAATNPAGLAFVGRRVDADITFFNPNRNFSVNSGVGTLPQGSYTSDETMFFIPNIGVNWPIDENSSIGLTMNGAGGMNTTWDVSVFKNFQGDDGTHTGVDLAQGLIALTYARKITPKHAVAFAPVIGVQQFKAAGFSAFSGVSSASNHLTGNGYDHSVGYGFRLGYQGELNDWLTVGVGYQSRIYMTEFEKYRGLFAEQGDFDIPQSIQAGLAAAVTPKLTVTFDWQWINYNSVRAIANSGNLNTSDVASVAQQYKLGNDAGIGFGWEDMNVFKVGAAYRYSDKLTFRGGFSVNDQNPYDENQVLFNVVAPAVIRAHATIGATYAVTENALVNFSYARGFSSGVSGTDVNINGEVLHHRMNQNEVMVGFTYQW